MATTRTRAARSLEQFLAVRRFSAGLAFTPDGRHVLFVTNISGQFNLWRVPVEGGWPDQLTAFTEETVRGLAVSHDGTIAFFADHDGDEFHQLYLLGAETGWPEKITDVPEAQHMLSGDAFSPDGTKLAFATRAPWPSLHVSALPRPSCVRGRSG